MDISIAPNDNHEMVAHRADCPVVRRLVARGVPVMTMLGITQPLRREKWMIWCSCLEKDKAA